MTPEVVFYRNVNKNMFIFPDIGLLVVFYLFYLVEAEYREEKQNWKVSTEQLSWGSNGHV